MIGKYHEKDRDVVIVFEGSWKDEYKFNPPKDSKYLTIGFDTNQHVYTLVERPTASAFVYRGELPGLAKVGRCEQPGTNVQTHWRRNYRPSSYADFKTESIETFDLGEGNSKYFYEKGTIKITF